MPQAKKLGTLSLPLSLLQYLASSSAPNSEKKPTTDPTVNSTATPVPVGQSHEHIHEREKEQAKEAEKAEGPSTRPIDSAGGSAEHAHGSAVNETDKTLLAELIPPPPALTETGSLPNGSASTSTTTNGNGNGNAQAVNGAATRILPAVNCMNTPDCHWLPDELLQYAREQGIELWAGGAGESCGTYCLASSSVIYNATLQLVADCFSC